MFINMRPEISCFENMRVSPTHFRLLSNQKTKYPPHWLKAFGDLWFRTHILRPLKGLQKIGTFWSSWFEAFWRWMTMRPLNVFNGSTTS